MTLFFLLLVVPQSYALDGPSNREQAPRAQALTVRTLQAMNQDRWSVGHDLVAEARDPLASKLYYWMLFSNRSNVKDYGHLAQFIRNNPEWPGIGALRKKAENDMPNDLRPEEVMAWFADYKPQTAAGVSRYMHALLITGKEVEAKTFLADWWASTTLSRDDQRVIFRQYNKYLDRAAHLRRFDAMLLRGQNTNARALAQVLGHGYPELAEARIALADEQNNVNGLINRVPPNLQDDPGLLFERLRWRRKNNLDMGAVEIFHKAPPVEKIQNPKDWWKERHIIIRRMLENKQYKSAYFLADMHFQTEGLEFAQAEWLAGWLALRFMDNPTKAYQHFETLHQNVESPMSKSRAAYWAGVAAESFSDQKISKQWYQLAARYQTVFYGQLAGAKLGLASALPNAAPPELSSDDIEQFNRAELLQAAKLFNRAGMKKESGRFLHAFVDHEKTPKAYRFAADLAVEMGQTHEAVRISKNATQKGLFLTAQSYPVITNRLQDINVEWALVHALIRQESMFDQDAQSPAGALGLMQLMPATAKETARKMGIAHQTGWLTSRPEHNIALGSRYLSDLLRRYDGSYPLAIAAYNAGPGRVSEWIKVFGDPRTGEVDLIDWIEMMPIYETRNYVQRVLEAVYVYRLRLNGIQKPSENTIHTAMAQE